MADVLHRRRDHVQRRVQVAGLVAVEVEQQALDEHVAGHPLGVGVHRRGLRRGERVAHQLGPGVEPRRRQVVESVTPTATRRRPRASG